MSSRFTLADLISLSKPRIIPLLLISMICPMVLAGGREQSLEVVLWSVLGAIFITASANAINCIIERDIDSLMIRTQDRPMARGVIPIEVAIGCSLLWLALGLSIMAFFVNLPALFASLAGHLFYVFVYTLWLKPRTPHNIVIGGAAGATPPIVGWAVVTEEVLHLTPWLIFIVVLFWTPPHFWALALVKNDDYRRAGIPMLPVVAGNKVTTNYMLFYALVLLLATVFLVYVSPDLSYVSLGVFSLVNFWFVFLIWQLKRSVMIEWCWEKKAWKVFGFSMIYLSIFFATLVIDSVFI